MAAGGLVPWLKRHGLGALGPVLARHHVDLDLLPHLGEDDLREMGLSLGQRRRLALALRADAPAGPVREAAAERRRLTVLFADLVGSTPLAARLDPEELREVIRGFQNLAAGEIARFGGHPAQFQGDGVLAWFGWPAAHEDEAERAVRAALAIARGTGQLAPPGGEPLAARVGIATGTVVVGGAHGADVSGETPNLAARLQQLAGPGEVVVAEATRRLVEGLFAVEDLGPRALKGFDRPQPAYRVSAERPVATRFDARHDEDGLTPMVGRDAEIAHLLDRWRAAEAGSGGLVLVVGEAGIGKSRLVRSLQRHLAGRRHVRLRYQCSPFHTDSALWPVTEQLARAAGFQAADGDAARLAKLRTLLAQATAAAAEDVALVAHLLGVEGEGAAAVAALPAALRKRRLLTALSAQLLGLARRAPVLLVLEDAHWIDPTTAELFTQAFAGFAALPVLAVVTHRPEHRSPWHGLPHATTLALEPLPPPAAAAIVAQVAPQLAPALVESIVEKADGVPLFIEEVARAVAESPAEGTGEPIAVPASLHDTLMARLDRLGGARRVAQIGAAVGRVFPPALLRRVVDLPAGRLGTALQDLVASGLVSRLGSGASAVYQFKHALVQDAAYGSLLKSQRREIHARIAAALAAEGEAAPELLAHHLTAAGRAEPAIAAWREAARRAVARAANLEATRQLGRALDLVPGLPEGERDPAELALRLELAVPLIALRGFGSEEVAVCAARARALAERVGDEAQRFVALRVVWNSTLMREPLPHALALARELMRLASASGDPARLAIAHRALGYTLCMSGRQREALPLLERGTALADQASDAAFAIYGEHPGLVCRFYAAWVLALTGDVETSRERADAAVALARRLGHPHGLAWALVCAAVPAMFANDPERAAAFGSEALSVAETYHLPQWSGFARNYGGWALFQSGERERGLNTITEGLEMVHATGAVLNTTLLLWTRAECRLVAGDLAGALADAEAGLDHAERYGEGIVLPQLWRIVGEIRLRQGGDASSAWARGAALAMEQGAVLWQRRLEDAVRVREPKEGTG